MARAPGLIEVAHNIVSRDIGGLQVRSHRFSLTPVDDWVEGAERLRRYVPCGHQALATQSTIANEEEARMNAAAKVLFTAEITPQSVVALYQALGAALPGRVAVKVHSGEIGNQNFTRPEFVKPMVDHVGGVIVEGNTAYGGARATTADHLTTMKLHGWSAIADVDILDAEGDMELLIPEGLCITRNFVGSHLPDYDSMLVLSHFKGHPMGGFGGALKNISIGVASAHGKAYIHGAGDMTKVFTAEQDLFLDSMADAAKTVVDFFGPGKMVFINIMKAMSVDCDCCDVAEDPELADIGILASLDPVGLDQACVDLVYASPDPGKKHLIERMEQMNGVRLITSAAKLGVGTAAYELVRIN